MRETLPLALDESVRSYDQDGHLHVKIANISKAAVNPYIGREIPDWQKLGLDPKRVYKLLRDPDELRKGAASFAGKSILSVHRPMTATDHKHSLVVGSVGSDIRYDHPYLRAPLSVWDGAAIAGIETEDQRELSSGYRYRADMTPGTYEGERYDGVMRDIQGNHVALVESGRAGSDVVVGDAALRLSPLVITKEATMATKPAGPMLSRKALLASGALRAYLHPKMAADKAIDLTPVLTGVTAKNWKASKPKIVSALGAATLGKLAADADIADVTAMLDKLDDVADGVADEPVPPPGPDPDDDGAVDGEADAAGRVAEFLEGKLSPEDIQAVLTLLKPEVDPPAGEAPPAAGGGGGKDNAPPFVKGKDAQPMNTGITKQAMDAALAKARTETEAATIAKLRAIAVAEREVRPHIGELTIAQDSAEAVYKLALDAAGIDLTNVPEAAYAAMVRMLPPKGEPARGTPRLGMDAAGTAKLKERFPNVGRLSHSA
jgi:hypothetical protein